MSTGLILLAHGARDVRWAAPFEAVAAQLRRSRPALPVRLAYLEFLPPALGEAAAALVASGCTDLHVMPMFLGAGGHVRRDLPGLLQAVRESHAGVTVTQLPAVGEIDSVVAAMAAAALQAVEARA